MLFFLFLSLVDFSRTLPQVCLCMDTYRCTDSTSEYVSSLSFTFVGCLYPIASIKYVKKDMPSVPTGSYLVLDKTIYITCEQLSKRSPNRPYGADTYSEITLFLIPEYKVRTGEVKPWLDCYRVSSLFHEDRRRLTMAIKRHKFLAGVTYLLYVDQNCPRAKFESHCWKNSKEDKDKKAKLPLVLTIRCYAELSVKKWTNVNDVWNWRPKVFKGDIDGGERASDYKRVLCIMLHECKTRCEVHFVCW